jgi:hypothetical protein
MNLRTSIVDIGIGYILIASTLVSSIYIYPSEILKPRKIIFII